MYIKRNDAGDIEQVSRVMTSECREPLASDSPELATFLNAAARQENNELRQSDLEFVRVLEDVIEVLMNKGVISFTDLPDAARDKLMARQNLRRRVNDVGLMDDSDSDTI
nr:tryptophan synthase subunit beta like protein [Halomonas socia]